MNREEKIAAAIDMLHRADALGLPAIAIDMVLRILQNFAMENG